MTLPGMMLTAVETLAKEIHAMEEFRKCKLDLKIPVEQIVSMDKKIEAFKLAYNFLKDLGYD